MTDETNNEPTSFTIPVYADVWKTNLQDYLEGERGDLEHNVTLHVGRGEGGE